MVDNTMSKEISRESKNNMNQIAQSLYLTTDFSLLIHYWCFKEYEVKNNYLQVLRAGV